MNSQNNYSIKNILGLQKRENNEFYTPKETVENIVNLVIKKLKNKVVWCPFDTQDSNFVKVLKEKNISVINTHINIKNGDFYKNKTIPKKWDLILSNPPFSKKRELIERCLSFNKDFCLLYGATIFSQSMGNTLNKCDFWFIQRDVRFTTDIEGKIKKFQCAWVANKNFFKNVK